MAVLLLLAAIIFQPRFIMEPLRTVLATVAWPVQGVFSVVAFEARETFGFFSSIGDLKQENTRLIGENIRLLGDIEKWRSVAQENEELRREVGLLPREKFDLQAAEVIGRDAAGLGNWLTVDQGSVSGIRPGMAVIVYDNVLVGRVMEVFPKSARVMLLSHPDSLVSAVTVTNRSQGIVKGEYGLGLLLDMVLQDATLETGDRLLSSGLGGGFPKDLLVGTLQDPRPSVDHLYQRASVVAPVPYESLRYIFIIKNHLPS